MPIQLWILIYLLPGTVYVNQPNVEATPTAWRADGVFKTKDQCQTAYKITNALHNEQIKIYECVSVMSSSH